jgi:hypothetical protein
MSSPDPQTVHRFISLRVKILLAFTLLFTLIFALTFYWFFRYSSQQAEDRLRDELAHILEAAVADIDGDEIIALYLEGEQREDGLTDDPRYWANLDWLNTVHEIEPRAWPGTYVRDGDQFHFVTDLRVLYEPETAEKFQELCDPAPGDCGNESHFEQWTSIAALSEGEAKLHPTITIDQDRSWLSGFAPLTDNEGEIAAGFFVEFEAEYIDEVEDGIRDTVLIAFAITYGFSFLFMYLIVAVGTRPILAFTRAAEAVGQGQYDQDFSTINKTRFPDEITKLVNVFSIMVAKVAEREASLKRQVEALTIEIDQVKKEREVERIVESDSFRDLQEKAKAMRSRREHGHDVGNTGNTS